jgi:hypothetical protein
MIEVIVIALVIGIAGGWVYAGLPVPRKRNPFDYGNDDPRR